MCIAAPGKVVEINDRRAIVEYPGIGLRQAMVMDLRPKVGSFVMVQMGIIIEVLSKSQAKIAETAWQGK
jgi:hydrogenase assembly chaperone HypC/HupF